MMNQHQHHGQQPQQQQQPLTQEQQQQQQQQLPPHSDNVDEELHRIHLALDTVFSPQLQPHHHAAAASQHHSGQQQQPHEWFLKRQLADRYLTSFQHSAVAWMVCDRLLQEGDNAAQHQHSSSSPHSQSHQLMVLQQRRFFAAQTLHTKCRTDVHPQLPPDSLPSLRDSLLAHLHRYAAAVVAGQQAGGGGGGGGGGDVALTTRLAMAISALAVQMQWTTIVTDLLQTLATTTTTAGTTPQHQHHQQQHHVSVSVNESSTLAVLFVLTALPEECASDRLLLLDDEHRFIMRDHLVASSPAVFHFLHTTMQQHQQQGRVWEALHRYIRYVPVRPLVIAESPLLLASVQALTQEPQYLEQAADVIVEVLRMYPSHHYGNEELIRRMIPLLAQQLPIQQALQSTDHDVWRAYCRIVTEMGESYSSWILSRDYRESSQLVDWVLQCSRIPDTEIASITLHFWYRLVTDLENLDPYDWRQELIDHYTPLLLQLVDVCASHLMRYPSSAELSSPSDNDDDDWNRHCFYVAETVEDCCRLLGGHAVLQRIGSLLRQEVERAAATQQQEWQGMESCLACMSAIHRFVPSDESDILPLVFELIPQLPADIRPLRCTASKTAGKYASWLAAHATLLQPVLPYLAHGLTLPECAGAAAVAIKELCECSNQSVAMAEPVLQLYQEIAAQPPPTTTSPSRHKLELKDELQILEGVCRALSRQSQDTHVDGTAYLNRLVQPIGHRLADAVSGTTPTSPHRILPEVERIIIIVQFMTLRTTANGTHPILELVRSIWNFLEMALALFPNDNHLAEQVCRLYKYALRSLGKATFAVMLDILIQQLVRSYERSHQSPFLYAASICITEYGPADPQYSARLYEMVAAMASTTFTFLRTLQDFTEHPDVVEEFFYLMGRMIGYCPDPLVVSPLLASLFQCAVVGMQLDHPGANKGIIKFLDTTVSYGLSLRELSKPESQKQALERVLAQEGGSIVANLTRALTGDMPAHGNQIPEILWKLNLLCPGLLAQWLTTSFVHSSASFMSERAKNDLLGALNTGLARDEFSLAVRAFQTACARERRARNMERRTR